ncbi:hypothetical protein GCM10010254_45630 [Streptomyces chromofuscus]|nr:hypothetical protein GCM10010254_45630 [Streptomyces chromofuscus]
MVRPARPEDRPDAHPVHGEARIDAYLWVKLRGADGRRGAPGTFPLPAYDFASS